MSLLRRVIDTRLGILIWVGVAGTAMTLVSGLAALRAVPIAKQIEQLLLVWRSATTSLWAAVSNFLGVDPSGPAVVTLNFMLFALSMAIGLRLQAQLATAQPRESKEDSPERGTRVWRIVAGGLLALPLPALFLYDSETPARTLMLLLALGCIFMWINGWKRLVLHIYLLSLVYSFCVYRHPLANALEQYSRPGDGSFYPIITEDDFAVYIFQGAWSFSAPAAVIVVFSAMLAIAPALQLRNRLVLSTLMALLILVGGAATSWLVGRM